MDIPTTAPSLFAYLTRVPNSYKTLYASSYSAFPVELPEPLTPRAKEKMSNLHVCVCVARMATTIPSQVRNCYFLIERSITSNHHIIYIYIYNKKGMEFFVRLNNPLHVCYKQLFGGGL